MGLFGVLHVCTFGKFGPEFIQFKNLNDQQQQNLN